MPRAFTEQGVAMLSGILNSDRAIAVNIQIMRTFTLKEQRADLPPALFACTKNYTPCTENCAFSSADILDFK